MRSQEDRVWILWVPITLSQPLTSCSPLARYRAALGDLLAARAEHYGDRADLDAGVAELHVAVEGTPRGDPLTASDLSQYWHCAAELRSRSSGSATEPGGERPGGRCDPPRKLEASPA